MTRGGGEVVVADAFPREEVCWGGFFVEERRNRGDRGSRGTGLGGIELEYLKVRPGSPTIYKLSVENAVFLNTF